MDRFGRAAEVILIFFLNEEMHFNSGFAVLAWCVVFEFAVRGRGGAGVKERERESWVTKHD